MIKSIEVFAICYNEEYMLPHFINHYKNKLFANGLNVDKVNITIFDNLSTDKSKQIILDNGCNYIPYDSGNTIRDDIYANIKNNEWKKSNSEWVIVCDIDEWLELNFDPSPYTLINTNGYDMVGDIDSRKGVFNIAYSKRIMFKPREIKQIKYTLGCHGCNPEGNVIPSKENANLLHRKYISEQYLFDRHLMYEKRLSDLNKQYGWGSHYINNKMEEIEKKFKELRAQAVSI